MIRIAANQIEKYYGANQVLKGLTLEIFEGEKVGILGPNGAGKSTLMRVLMQEEPYDAGDLFITRGARLGALNQIPVFDMGMTVLDCLKTAFRDLFTIKTQIDTLENQMSGNQDERLLKKYGELIHKFEHGGGYTIEDRIEDIAKGFNFDETILAQDFESLSGGEKTRVGLATMLLKPLDVIFLDEPTNHLDLNTIEWLENYINAFNGTVIIISHDRYFLNQIVTRIIEVNRGIATSYKGNYDDYTRERTLMIRQAEERFEQEQKKIKQLEEAAKRMHDWAVRADSGALHRRAFAIEKRIERMDKTDRLLEDKRMVDAFDTTRSTSKEVIRIKTLSKAFGDNAILKEQSLTVYKDQKIALLGNNGAGKSTLMKMLLQLESPDDGQIEWSPSAVVGYLPQEIAFDYPNMTVLEYIKEALELEEGVARNLLARYKFKQEDVFKALSGLSGGERTRLKLCELMSNKVNVLLLDEPTNHLDIT
jgi:ATPase subunit of ABC transporter with duplicated ATPase domains